MKEGVYQNLLPRYRHTLTLQVNMAWNYNFTNAPRGPLIKVAIAVANSRKVRWCVWNSHKRCWSGLLPGEVPLAFQVIEHPDNGKLSLPIGMKI